MTPARMRRRRYRDDPAVLDLEERTASSGARLPDGWVKQARGIVQDLGKARLAFTIVDLREAGVPEPPAAAHWGGLIHHLHVRGVIEPAGLTMQTATDGCTRPTRVWRVVDPEGGPLAA